jgi:hypothetical protein
MNVKAEFFQGELNLLLGPTPQRHIREILSGKMDGRFLPQMALISRMKKESLRTQSASFQSVNQRNQWFTFLVSHSKQLRNIKPPEDGDECDAGEDGARSCATPLIKEKTTFL